MIQKFSREQTLTGWLIHQSLITGVISKRTIAEQVQQLDVWNIPFSKNPISARKVDKYFT